MPAILDKPHNGRLAARFPEVTQAEFFRRELKCTVGFDREEIQLSLNFACMNSAYHVYCRYTPREGLGTVKLFVGVAGKDVTVNNKGGATCNNTKQLLLHLS